MEVPKVTQRDVSYALSNKDINDILYKNPTRIYKYEDLATVTDLKSMLDSEGRMVLLIPVNSEFEGHWVCLWLSGKTWNYFDPYGLPPDYFLQHWETEDKPPAPYLSDLLKAAK